MSYRLIVTEKPIVVQSIAKVLKVRNRKEGYLEGNGYLITWCVGHLVGLADAYKETVITAEQLQLFSSSVKTKDSVGVCPWCGSEVYEGKSGYYCSDKNGR